MATVLENAIDSLSDPHVSISDALRRLLVVARRINASDLDQWLRAELEGYGPDAGVPEYRDGSTLPIAIRFDGYGGSQTTRRVTPAELPAELQSVMEGMKMRQPLGELAALAARDGDSEVQLPNVWLARYRQLASENKVPHMPMTTANHVAVQVPRTYLVGMLDRIKSIALDLALDLEEVSTAAGSNDGPTVESNPALGDAVATHMTTIFATNSNVSIASGAGATTVQVQAGDVDGLLRAAASLVGPDGVAALGSALDNDGGQPDDATRTFLQRVRGGGIALVGGLTVNGAYDGLVALLEQVFPGFN